LKYIFRTFIFFAKKLYRQPNGITFLFYAKIGTNSGKNTNTVVKPGFPAKTPHPAVKTAAGIEFFRKNPTIKLEKTAGFG